MTVFATYHQLRHALFLCIVKTMIDTVTVVHTIFFPVQHSQSQPKAAIYVSVTRRHVFLCILSLRSLYHFLPDLHFFLIDDGTLSWWHRWLIKKTNLPLAFISQREKQRIHQKLYRHPHLMAFYNYGWSGKKFVIPFLHAKTTKVIVLDCDTFFFRFPNELQDWIHADKAYHLFIQDYENFSVVSPIEAHTILGKLPHITKINSGLLCFDLPTIMVANPLSVINDDIYKIIQIVKSRMRYDYNNPNDMVYVFPLIEQTLHWLMLSRSASFHLPSSYAVFPSHKFRGAPLTNPSCIHFTGEKPPTNQPMYKYLFFSLLLFCFDLCRRGLKSTKPWFIYSTEYCPRCRHIN